MKYLMIKYWWVTSYKFIVRIIYLKGLFPHPNVMNSTYWVISPPFIPLIDTLEGSLEYRFLEDNSYELFCWTEDFIIIFMVLNIVLENYFWGFLSLVELELWKMWWDFRLLVTFIYYFMDYLDWMDIYYLWILGRYKNTV